MCKKTYTPDLYTKICMQHEGICSKCFPDFRISFLDKLSNK